MSESKGQHRGWRQRVGRSVRGSIAGVVVFLAAPCAEAQALDAYRASVGASLNGNFARQDNYTLVNPGASLGFTVWPWRRVVDDDTPTSVQSFLQHPDDLGATVSGNGTWGHRDDGSYSVTGSTLGLSVAGGHWFGEYYVGLSVLAARYATTVLNGAVYPTPSTSHLELVQPGLALAYHFGTSEFAVKYLLRLRWDADGPEPTNWGSVAVTVDSVIDNDAQMILTAYTIDGDGFGGSAFYETFVSRRFGIFASLGYQSGALYVDTNNSYNSLGMSMGVGWWLSGSLKLEPTLSFTGAELNADGASRFWTENLVVNLEWRVL